MRLNPLIAPIHDQLALYAHIPFCGVRCTYCAFNVVTKREALIPTYVNALCREISWLGQSAAEASTAMPLRSIYLGGGTPSLLSAEQVAQVLDACRSAFRVLRDVEITLEANPGGLDARYFEQLRSYGVNRLSIGMQSAHPAELRLFARQHGFAGVAETMQAARQAGHDNISLDLIYGVPNQSLTMWHETVEKALSLSPDHVSIYALQLESGTPLTRRVARGTLPTPDDDLAADMYETAEVLFAAAGLSQYEISAWARPGCICRHNVHYWRNAPFVGVGAGAHGCVNGLRYKVVRDLDTYIACVNSQSAVRGFPLTASVDDAERVDQDQAMDDTLMTGLRLTQGIDLAEFAERFGVPLEVIYADALTRLAPYDMLDLSATHIRLKPRARLISNQVLLHFIREGETVK